jgi:GAF domain-containing protein
VVIEDARSHPILQTNLAVRDLGVIAYAGVPVCSVQGQTLGSLCAIDSQPRAWKDEDLVTLTDFTKLVECCVARSELGRQQPANSADLDKYVEAAGSGISSSVRILRREWSSLAKPERDLLLEIIEELGDHLVQLNRLIQISKALR